MASDYAATGESAQIERKVWSVQKSQIEKKSENEKKSTFWKVSFSIDVYHFSQIWRSVSLKEGIFRAFIRSLGSRHFSRTRKLFWRITFPSVGTRNKDFLLLLNLFNKNWPKSKEQIRDFLVKIQLNWSTKVNCVVIQ